MSAGDDLCGADADDAAAVSQVIADSRPPHVPATTSADADAAAPITDDWVRAVARAREFLDGGKAFRIAAVQRMVDMRLRPNDPTFNGSDTALTWAAAESPQLLEALLDLAPTTQCDVDVNARDASGATALYWAVLHDSAVAYYHRHHHLLLRLLHGTSDFALSAFPQRPLLAADPRAVLSASAAVASSADGGSDDDDDDEDDDDDDEAPPARGAATAAVHEAFEQYGGVLHAVVHSWTRHGGGTGQHATPDVGTVLVDTNWRSWARVFDAIMTRCHADGSGADALQLDAQGRTPAQRFVHHLSTDTKSGAHAKWMAPVQRLVDAEADARAYRRLLVPTLTAALCGALGDISALHVIVCSYSPAHAPRPVASLH